MKVVKKGRPQKGWAKEYVCTGKGNDGGGCGAKLLVEQGDLFHTSKHSYGDQYPEYFTTFECAECGVFTDISSNEPPISGSNLPNYDDWKARQYAQAAQEQDDAAQLARDYYNK